MCDTETTNRPIHIMGTLFEYLSPFSAHSITIWGEVFPTVEHAYQASRIKPGPQRDRIKSAPSPLDAWREGQKCKGDLDLLIEKFNKNEIMESIFRAKMEQHPDIVAILKNTEGRDIQKNHDDDYYWGTGLDGSGENRMGKIWMKLRAELSY